MSEEMPFAVGSMYGVRDWIVGTHSGALLPIAYNDYIWKDGENVARCFNAEQWPTLGTAEPARPCLSWDHGCGFYAYHGLGGRAHGEVTGVIRAYGRLAIGSRGFRAEKAKIVALCLPDKPDWTVRLWRRSVNALIAVFVTLLLMEISLYVAIVALVPWSFLVGLPFGYLMCWTTATGLRAPIRSRNHDPVRAAAIQARYPSAKIYRSKLAMASRYGLLSPRLHRKTSGPGAFARWP